MSQDEKKNEIIKCLNDDLDERIDKSESLKRPNRIIKKIRRFKRVLAF